MWPLGAWGHPYAGYLLPPCGSKRKGGQVRFTPQQTQSLERRFANHKYLSPEDRRHLAIQLKLSDRQVSLLRVCLFYKYIYLIIFLNIRSKRGSRTAEPSGGDRTTSRILAITLAYRTVRCALHPPAECPRTVDRMTTTGRL